MERIKEALQRARAEREAAGLGDGPALLLKPANLVDRDAELALPTQRLQPPERALAHEPAQQPPAKPPEKPPGKSPAKPTKKPLDESADGNEESSQGVRVAYTKTRTLRLDPERLRARRVLLNEEDRNPILDAYRVLRTRVLQRLRANAWNAIAITSPRPGCGKTLTSINLAISLAREVNQTVLLADLDLHRPAVIRYFTDEDLPGVSDYLLEQRELAEILVNPSIERLVILPGHSSFNNSSEMLSTPRMVRLVTELKTRYPDRIVLFDMPPLLTGDDVLAFSPYLDAIMLVVEAGGTTRDDLKRAWNLLDGKPNLGAVLNKADDDASGYGYY